MEIMILVCVHVCVCVFVCSGGGSVGGGDGEGMLRCCISEGLGQGENIHTGLWKGNDQVVKCVQGIPVDKNLTEEGSGRCGINT